MKLMIKRFRIIIALLVLQFTICNLVDAQPQGPKRFDPAEFQNELHKYIAEKAQLTNEEQTAFFPIYDQMKEKERALYSSQRKMGKIPQTDADFVEAIKNYDKIDVELKKLQQTYHLKFMKVLPAKKVFRVIRAEDTFRVHMFKKMGRPEGFQRPMPQKKK